MAYQIKFFRGTSEAYLALTSRNDRTFYFTTDDHQLYIGDLRLTNTKEVSEALERISENEENLEKLENELKEIFGEEGIAGIITRIDDAINELDAEVNATKTSLDENAIAVVSGVTQKDGKIFSVKSVDADVAGAASSALREAKGYTDELFDKAPIYTPLTNAEIESLLSL